MPHDVQNFVPSSSGVPQTGHTCLGVSSTCFGASLLSSFVPHDVQNFVPSSSGVPQTGHTSFGVSSTTFLGCFFTFIFYD